MYSHHRRAAAPSEYGPGPSKDEASEYGSFEPPRKKHQEHRDPPRSTTSVSERLMQMSANPDDDEPRGSQQSDQHRRDSRDSRDSRERVSASTSQVKCPQHKISNTG